MAYSLRSCLVLLTSMAFLGGCPTGDDDDDVVNCTSDQIPAIVIVSPETGAFFEDDQNINWSLTVTDADTAAEDLSITLQDNSSSQGLELDITVPTPNANGQTNFTVSANLLEDGQAVVRVFAEDPDGCSSFEQVVICINELVGVCL
jgi:hypothetical protein